VEIRDWGREIGEEGICKNPYNIIFSDAVASPHPIPWAEPGQKWTAFYIDCL